MRRFLTKLRAPVAADGSIDVMAAAFWLCLAGWGVASVIKGLPTLSDTTTPLYVFLWGATIGILGLVAFGAAVSVFFDSHDIKCRIRKKTIEMVAIILLAGFISVYPIFVLGLAIAGDASRVSTVFASATYLIFPIWRSRHLYMRIRALRLAAGLLQ